MKKVLILLLLATIFLGGCYRVSNVGDNSSLNKEMPKEATSPNVATDKGNNEFQLLVEDFVYNALVVKDREKIAEMTNLTTNELESTIINYDFLLLSKSGVKAGYMYHSINKEKAYITWNYLNFSSGVPNTYVFNLRKENGKWYFNCTLDGYKRLNCESN